MKYSGKIIGLGALLAAQTIGSMAYASAKIESGEDLWLSIGVGARTSFSAIEDSAPNGSDWSNDFNLDSARVYINGQIHKNLKFEFNTECVFCANDALRDYTILDAIAKFELTPGFNIWAGRLLVPSDRAEMSGPYYANTYDFNKTPFYPSDYSVNFGNGGAGVYGRDHGVTIWGGLTDEKRLTYALGVFNGYQGGSNQSDNFLYAGRVSYNFLNVESNPGYYTSSTYYGGAGDVLTAALVVQHQADGAGTKANATDFTGYSVDVLYEKVAGNEGVFTLEGEYKSFDTDLNAAALLSADCFCMFDGDSWTATALYMFPNEMGIGKLQPYVRYTDLSPDNSAGRDEYELGMNYIIKGHNARVSMFYQYGDIATKGLNYTPSAAGDDVGAFKIALQYQY